MIRYTTLRKIHLISDPLPGNVIEWCYPDDYDLTGVEFKAMPSGAHNVQHDVVVFEVNGNFGMAAFMMKQVLGGLGYEGQVRL